MKPHDVVALILTIGVVVGLLSGTRIGMWMFPIQHTHPVSDRAFEFWSNTTNVIIGALAGYIAGRSTRD